MKLSKIFQITALSLGLLMGSGAVQAQALMTSMQHEQLMNVNYNKVRETHFNDKEVVDKSRIWITATINQFIAGEHTFEGIAAVKPNKHLLGSDEKHANTFIIEDQYGKVFSVASHSYMPNYILKKYGVGSKIAIVFSKDLKKVYFDSIKNAQDVNS